MINQTLSKASNLVNFG